MDLNNQIMKNHPHSPGKEEKTVEHKTELAAEADETALFLLIIIKSIALLLSTSPALLYPKINFVYYQPD